jgi:hypothetical protein
LAAIDATARSSRHQLPITGSAHKAANGRRPLAAATGIARSARGRQRARGWKSGKPSCCPCPTSASFTQPSAIGGSAYQNKTARRPPREPRRRGARRRAVRFLPICRASGGSSRRPRRVRAAAAPCATARASTRSGGSQTTPASCRWTPTPATTRCMPTAASPARSSRRRLGARAAQALRVGAARQDADCHRGGAAHRRAVA